MLKMMNLIGYVAVPEAPGDQPGDGETAGSVSRDVLSEPRAQLENAAAVREFHLETKILQFENEDSSLENGESKTLILGRPGDRGRYDDAGCASAAREYLHALTGSRLLRSDHRHRGVRLVRAASSFSCCFHAVFVLFCAGYSKNDGCFDRYAPRPGGHPVYTAMRMLAENSGFGAISY